MAQAAPSGMPPDKLFQYRRAPKFNPDIQDVLDNYDNQNACLFNGINDGIKIDVLLGETDSALSHAAELNEPPFTPPLYDAFLRAIEAGNKELISERITYIRRKRYQELEEGAKKEFLRGRMSDVNLETFMENFYAERTADASSEEDKVNTLQASIDENEQELLSLQTIYANSPTPKTQRSIVALEKKLEKEKRDLVVKKEAETEATQLKETTKGFLDRIAVRIDKMEGETEADYNARVEKNRDEVFDHLYDEFIGDKFDKTYTRYNKIKAAEKGKDKLKVKGIEVVMLPPKGVYLTYGLQQLPFLMDCSLVGDIREKSVLDLNLYITPYFEQSGSYQTPNKKVSIVWGIPNDRWTEPRDFFPELGHYNPGKIGNGIFSAGNPSKALGTIKSAILESMPGLMADDGDNGGGGGGLGAGGGARNHEDTAKRILNDLAMAENDTLLRVCFFNKDRTDDQNNLYKYHASVMMLLNPDFNLKNHILGSDTVITTPTGKQFKWSFTYSKTTPTHVIFFFMESGIAYTVSVEVSFRVQSKSLSHIFGDNLEPLFNPGPPIPGIKPSILAWAEALKASFFTDYQPIIRKPYLLPMVSTAGPAAGALLVGGSPAAAAGPVPDIGRFTIDKKWRIMIQAMLDLDKLHDSASYRLKKAGIDEAEINKIHAALIEKVNERIDELMKELVPDFRANGVPDDFMASIPTEDPLDNFLYRFCGSLRCFFLRDFSSAKYEITVLMFFLKSIEAFVRTKGEFVVSGIPPIQGLMRGEGIWADNAARFPRYPALYPRGGQPNPVLCNFGTAFDGGTDLTSDPITIMINRGIQIVENDGSPFMEYIPKQGLSHELVGKTKDEIREWFKDSVKFVIHGNSGPKVYEIDPLDKLHNAQLIMFELMMKYFNSRGDFPTDKKAICDLSQHFFLLDYGGYAGDVPCGLVQNDLMSGIFDMLLLIATKDELKGVKMVGIWCPVRVLWFRIEKTEDDISIQLHCVSECLSVKKSEIIEDDDSDGEDEEGVASSLPSAAPASSSSSSSSLVAPPAASSSLPPASLVAPPASLVAPPDSSLVPPTNMDLKKNQSGGFTKRKKTKRRKRFNKSKTQGNKWRRKSIRGGAAEGGAEESPEIESDDLDTVCYKKLLEQLEFPETPVFKQHTVFHVFAYRYLMIKGDIVCSFEEYIENPRMPTRNLLELYDIHFFRSMRLAEYMMVPEGDIYSILLEIDQIERLMRDAFNKQMVIQEIVHMWDTTEENLLSEYSSQEDGSQLKHEEHFLKLSRLYQYSSLSKLNWEQIKKTISGGRIHKMIERSSLLSELESIEVPDAGVVPKTRWEDYHVKRLLNLGDTNEGDEGPRGAKAAGMEQDKNYLLGNGREMNLQTNKNRAGCFENGLFNVPLTKPSGMLEAFNRIQPPEEKQAVPVPLPTPPQSRPPHQSRPPQSQDKEPELRKLTNNETLAVAARKIQKIFRGVKGRNITKKTYNALRQIQKVFRGFKGRKLTKKMKETMSSLVASAEGDKPNPVRIKRGRRLERGVSPARGVSPVRGVTREPNNRKRATSASIPREGVRMRPNIPQGIRRPRSVNKFRLPDKKPRPTSNPETGKTKSHDNRPDQ